MLTLNHRFIHLEDNDIVLDLGCGEGRHITGLIDLKNNVYFIGLDLNRSNLNCTKKKIAQYFSGDTKRVLLLEGNGLSLPLQDGSIQHVICSEVLEHIVDYEKILKEIKRVLKPEGKFYVSVPRRWPEKLCWWLSEDYHTVEGGHVHIFNSAELSQKISELGFNRYKKHWAHALHSPYWWLKCIFKSNENFFLLRWYHRLLVWDILQKPFITQFAERILNPVLGKSVVLYFSKSDINKT